MNIDEILSGARQGILDRLSSPFWGSFLISWSIINYEAYLILFSDNSVTTTLHLMNTLVFTDDWTFILNALIAPLLAALTYIYIYPIPARWFYGYTLTQQLEQNRLKQRLEDTELLTVEQSKALKVRLYELTKNHAQDLERLREEIEILEQRLKSREVTHEEKSHEYAGFEHEELLELRLQNLMHSVLKEISHRNEGMDISTAKKSFDADSIEVEHAIDKLLDKEMIDEVRFRHSGRLFLTPSGREALIKGRFLTPDQRLGL